MITIIAYVLVVLTNLVSSHSNDSVVIVPPMPQYWPTNGMPSDKEQWDEYWHDAYYESLEEWDTLYSNYEVKRARNGAMMIRSGSTGSFKFAKKG